MNKQRQLEYLATADEPGPVHVRGKQVAYARHPGEIYVLHGAKLGNVHLKDVCDGNTCVIHKPTDHHMRGWRLHWRNDRMIFERICEHGVGHPDPDQFDFWVQNGMEGMGLHGCDGCCRDS